MSKIRPEKNDIWISNDTKEKWYIFKITKYPVNIRNLKPLYNYKCYFINIENIKHELNLADFKRLYSYYGKANYSFSDLFKKRIKNKSREN